MAVLHDSKTVTNRRAVGTFLYTVWVHIRYEPLNRLVSDRLYLASQLLTHRQKTDNRGRLKLSSRASQYLIRPN